MKVGVPQSGGGSRERGPALTAIVEGAHAPSPAAPLEETLTKAEQWGDVFLSSRDKLTKISDPEQRAQAENALREASHLVRAATLSEMSRRPEQAEALVTLLNHDTFRAYFRSLLFDSETPELAASIATGQAVTIADISTLLPLTAGALHGTVP